MPGRLIDTKFMAPIGATAFAVFSLLVCVFAATTGATEPDKTAPTVSLSGTAVKAIEEGKATGSYQLHIAATDGSKSAPQSGVAKIEVAVDGYGQQSWEKYCPEGSCGLEENWAYVPSNYTPEGPRWITVKVTDHAGNATEEEISLEGIEEVPREAAPTGSDKTPPTITLAGSAEKTVWQGASSGKYELRMFATDGSPSAPQSGVAKVEVAVDGTTLQSWEKYCPVGSCRLMVSWPYSPGNFSGTHHYIVVTARDHAGNVATKKIEWDPTPPVVSASGELKNLENHYINGQGTKTVAVSATDNHSGVRLLSLEDEGHGVLVSKTPSGCVLKPLKDEECPLATSETLTADTTKMPEGTNHLRVVAEDFAGNVTRGTAWTVYVDRVAPRFEDGLRLIVSNTVGEVAPEAFFLEAKDPLSPDGSPGSGVAGYEYRYAVNGSAYTAWSVTSAPYFVATGAKAGDQLSAQVRAYDLVGNRSEGYSESQVVPNAQEATPEAEEPIEKIFSRSKYVASEAQSSLQQGPFEQAAPLDSSENSIPPEIRKEFHEAFLHGEGCESAGTPPEVRLLNGVPKEVSDVYVKCVPETYLVTASFTFHLRKVVPGMAIAPIEAEVPVVVSGPATGEPKGPYRVSYECQSSKVTEWLADTHAKWFHFNPVTKRAWERSSSDESDFVEDSCY